MKPLITVSVVSLITVAGFSCSQVRDQSNAKPNILLICVDDLRPELACYGKKYIHSPHIDKLAKTGFLFTNHFVQVPTCGASRYAMLTGMLPKTPDHLDNTACRQFIAGRPEGEDPETFIHHLRRNGYYTVGIGKISHYVDGYCYGPNEPVSTDPELPHSWDEMLFHPGKWGTAPKALFGYADGTNREDRNKQVKPYEMGSVDDMGYPDGYTTELALEKLDDLAKKDVPFFLAVGYLKPHLPFNSPKKYWDLYEEADLPLSPSPFIPENVHPASLIPSGEFNQYALGEEKASLEGPVSDSYARKLRHAYFACISYIDAQIGILLKELERQGLADNTIVVLWGDHGWQLGDHLVWGKHTIFERSLRSPLIICLPGEKKGAPISSIVSSVDIYPTIVELAGLNMTVETDGCSLVPLLHGSSMDGDNRSYGFFEGGITLRTERYRLTRYYRNEEPTIELYDHDADPNENLNTAADYAAVVDSLMPMLVEKNIYE
jgi:arylsulfatase A-like enzyme